MTRTGHRAGPILALLLGLVRRLRRGPAEATFHGDRRLRANHTVPFVVWGVDAARGADLCAVNPERVRPGRGWPGYRRPPVPHIDLARLVTTLLGNGRVPGGVLPRTTPLEVS